MIVRLTHHQANSVARRVSELQSLAMSAHRTKYGRTQHDYDLPAIAWRQILDAMLASCFGPVGGKLDRGVSGSAYRAIRRISEQVKRAERHPALRGAAIEGWVGDVIPAWEVDGGWSPYPGPGRFVLLVPEHVEVHGMRITRWAPADETLLGALQAQLRTNQEEFHAVFVGEVGAPLAE
jgi:hypothetical protein